MHSYFDALLAKDTELAKEKFRAIYSELKGGVYERLERRMSRMICVSDATGSMHFCYARANKGDWRR